MKRKRRELLAFRRAWQPMETAPKDGTEVLLLIANGGDASLGMHMLVCKFRSNPDGWVNTLDDEYGDVWPPLRWMPLPPLPQGEKP